MSPVVQNLENVAISDPSYQNGQTRNSLGQPQQQAINLPPPPPPQEPPSSKQAYQPTSSISPVSAMSQSHSGSNSARAQEPAQTFAPMAYNPAAPPAPEPIAHREDTPPPPDDGQGTGLAAAVHDNPSTYGRSQSQPWGGVPQPGHQPYQVGQPQPPTFGSPPPPSAPSSFSGPTAVSVGSDGRNHSTTAQHYVPSPTDPHGQMYNQQPVETPGAQFYPTNPNQPHKPLQHNQPQYPDYLGHNVQNPPPGGYSQYHYGHPQQQQQQSPQQQPGGNNAYDVHSQVYRPTETEHAHHHRKPSRTATSAGAEKSKWEARADKVEKKGGKFLKKLGI
jgi:hypothetical protein